MECTLYLRLQLSGLITSDTSSVRVACLPWRCQPLYIQFLVSLAYMNKAVVQGVVTGWPPFKAVRLSLVSLTSTNSVSAARLVSVGTIFASGRLRYGIFNPIPTGDHRSCLGCIKHCFALTLLLGYVSMCLRCARRSVSLHAGKATAFTEWCESTSVQTIESGALPSFRVVLCSSHVRDLRTRRAWGQVQLMIDSEPRTGSIDCETHLINHDNVDRIPVVSWKVCLQCGDASIDVDTATRQRECVRRKCKSAGTHAHRVTRCRCHACWIACAHRSQGCVR